MRRHLLVLGLIVSLIAGLAAIASIQTSTQEAEAQVTPIELNTLCLNRFTGHYYGSFTGNCAPNFIKLDLPDAYPLSLCASRFEPHLRRPQPNGECAAPNLVRYDLPSATPVEVCYVRATGRLRVPLPFPNGDCGTGVGGGILVTFPSGFDGIEDTYQTLGNVDIDVPADAGVLANDTGQGLTVTAFDATSANGGDVTMNPDGSFTYTPPAPAPNAFIGDDTFSYTVEDSDANSETVTVTIQVLPPAVWFVDADATDPGDGRRLTPLNDIQVLNDDGNDPDNPGDFIFLFEATNGYIAAFDLETGQYLVGQEVDLAEILTQAIEGTALAGLDAEAVPPYIVVPDENPTGDIPLLTNEFIGLIMDDDSTAVGLTIESESDIAVLVNNAEDTALDRVEAYGGTDLNSDGQPGVIVVFGSLAVIDSLIRGGNGDCCEAQITGTSLQGNGSDPGNGGPGIFIDDSSVSVTGSNVSGGDGGLYFNDTSALQGSPNGGPFAGGSGGNGISLLFGDVAVSDASIITGGDGTYGEVFGGNGGQGIAAIALLRPASANERLANHQLQGELQPGGGPSISVSGSSTVEGGNGGDARDFAGNGGDGIRNARFIVTVTEGSTVSGGNGGNASVDNGGHGGTGIRMDEAFFGEASSPALLGANGDLTILTVDSSTVEGGDAGIGANDGGHGGDGIIALIISGVEEIQSGSSLQGFGDAQVIDINLSTVTGGAGGDATNVPDIELQTAPFVDAGDGGFGIVVGAFSGCCFGQSTLQGQMDDAFDLNVTSSTVSGGPGGDAASVGAAGDGGWGILNGQPFLNNIGVSAMSDRELEGPGSSTSGANLAVVDSTVTGASGGASTNVGGDGGVGIFTAGSLGLNGIEPADLQGIQPSLMTTISNSTVNGGDGGGIGATGNGGDGISSIDMALTVDQGSQVNGGNGGNGTIGAAGGDGIRSEISSVSITATSVTGGDGGNGTSNAGRGGHGLNTFESAVTIGSASSISGGNGGASNFAAAGGAGILMAFSTVDITNSTVNGGSGGSGIVAFIDDSQLLSTTDGGDGGAGIDNACQFCNTLTVGASTVNGGTGGNGDSDGQGGDGIAAENDNVTVTNSTVSGGTGDIGGRAVSLTVTDGGGYLATIQNNTLTGGSNTLGGGNADSLSVVVTGTGSICVDASGNTPTGDFTLDNGAATGTLGHHPGEYRRDERGQRRRDGDTSTGTVSFGCGVPD